MKLRATSYGKPGSSHVESEDSFEINPLENGGLLGVLSDGVGSARDPRRCSERTVRLIADGFSARPRQWTVRKVFDRLVEQANKSLYEEGFYRDGTASMQATLSTVLIQYNHLSGCNAGDSPVFIVRGEIVTRLSETHSLIDREGRDTLTRAIGMGTELVPHYFEQELTLGDRILIVSDGVTKLVDDQTLGGIIRKSASARQIVAEVLERREQKEIDDVSAILIEVEKLGPTSPEAAPSEPWPSPKKGALHDGYRLLQSLGGNSRVWLSEKKGRKYVLKFVPEEAQTDDSGTILSRFASERWAACRAASHFFVPCHAPESGSIYYYVMDYVESPSLRFVLKSRVLALDEAIELGKFLCRSEQYLLDQELVHGDVKPDNILIIRDGGAIDFKLLDLGLTTPIFTDTGASGTPSYLAPERFRGAAVTERSEIYSIGATLYEILTGRAPFGQIERFQIPRFGRIPPPSRFNPNVPQWLDRVILQCLSLNQEKRFQCYTELLFVLEHPEKTLPFVSSGDSLLEQNPLRFYQVCSAILLLIVIILSFKLLSLSR